jgi:hypothetical protein
MEGRSEELQRFLDAANAAWEERTVDAEARRTVRQAFLRLGEPGLAGSGAGKRLPVCAHLEAARALGQAAAVVEALVREFRAIEPRLEWRRRSVHDGSASENFAEGHANALIVGPGGLEDRDDVWLGASLLAPGVRYPDHDHAPEEVYLVLSEGEFRHGGSDWFSPGLGGTFYNRPGIRHAMRSGQGPLFAFWVLQAAA